jgi:hypothetical protein
MGSVGVGVGVGEPVEVSVCVGVSVGVSVRGKGVDVVVAVCVAVGSDVGELSDVATEVWVSVLVAEAVADSSGTADAVAVDEDVPVGVAWG